MDIDMILYEILKNKENLLFWEKFILKIKKKKVRGIIQDHKQTDP